MTCAFAEPLAWPEPVGAARRSVQSPVAEYDAPHIKRGRRSGHRPGSAAQHWMPFRCSKALASAGTWPGVRGPAADRIVRIYIFGRKVLSARPVRLCATGATRERAMSSNSPSVCQSTLSGMVMIARFGSPACRACARAGISQDSGHYSDRRGHARTFPRNRVKHTARRARASFAEPVDDCLGFFANTPDELRRCRRRHLGFHFPVYTDRPELIVQKPF